MKIKIFVLAAVLGFTVASPVFDAGDLHGRDLKLRDDAPASADTPSAADAASALDDPAALDDPTAVDDPAAVDVPTADGTAPVIEPLTVDPLTFDPLTVDPSDDVSESSGSGSVDPLSASADDWKKEEEDRKKKEEEERKKDEEEKKKKDDDHEKEKEEDDHDRKKKKDDDHDRKKEDGHDRKKKKDDDHDRKKEDDDHDRKKKDDDDHCDRKKHDDKKEKSHDDKKEKKHDDKEKKHDDKEKKHKKCGKRKDAKPFHREYTPSFIKSHVIGFFFRHHDPSTVRLFSYFNKKTGDYIYTTKKSGRVPQHYKPQGVAGWVYPDCECDGVALYSLFHWKKQRHFYTTSIWEKKEAIKNGYKYEDIVAYIYPLTSKKHSKQY